MPTCAGCVKLHYKPLYPGNPKYPKNPRPGDLFFIDECDVIHRFTGMTGPPSTRPDPKDIERDQKKVADYIKEKQAQRDKELEESNKKAEELLAKDLKEAEEVAKDIEERTADCLASAEPCPYHKKLAEEKKPPKLTKEEAAAMDAANMARLQRTAAKFGCKVVEKPRVVQEP